VNANWRLSGYLAVPRKHPWLLSGATLLVLASGLFYLWRQPPVYESEALLLIEQPVLSLMGTGPKKNYFGITQAALNTELILLREDEAQSQRAIDAMAGGPGPLPEPPVPDAEERERDPEGYAQRFAAEVSEHERRIAGHQEELRAHRAAMAELGYTTQALRSRVSVVQMYGTEGLVRFSLTSGDAETLPSAVNAYADAYRQDAQRKRTVSFELQQRDLDARLRAAKQDLVAAEAARDAFAAEHEAMDLAGGDNPAAVERATLSQRVEALRHGEQADRAAQRHVKDALDDLGIKVERIENATAGAAAECRLTVPGDGAGLHEALAGSAQVSGLECVRSHPEVALQREVESELMERERDLEEQGILEDHSRRRAIKLALQAARTSRGEITARSIEIELTDIAHRAQHLADVETRLTAAKAREREFNVALAGYQRLVRKVAEEQREYDEAVRKLEDFTNLFLARDGDEPGDENGARTPLRISIRVPAKAATQVAPKVPLVLGLTVVAALVTGLGIVFLFEFLDDTIRSKDDFDRYVGLPFLGFIPRISERDHPNPDTAAESNPGSAVAEAFRAVRTSILFTKQLESGRTLLVTSAGPGEGKTTIATNLATAFARKKGPVLLVDADLRKPRVAKALGIDAGLGLSSLLAGQAQLDDVVRPTHIDGLMAVTSGPIPPNPAELLHGERMAEFLAQASERFECILLDTPPLVAVSDARVLAGHVDGFFLVISMGKTSRRLIQRAVESLTSIGFGVDGVVLNNMSSSESRYGDYYYAREYRDE
jgi:capsular exopolysaccharide synthesis family protein